MLATRPTNYRFLHSKFPFSPDSIAILDLLSRWNGEKWSAKKGPAKKKGKKSDSYRMRDGHAAKIQSGPEFYSLQPEFVTSCSA